MNKFIHFPPKLITLLPITLLVLFCAVILTVSLRGIAGNPTENTINELQWSDNGPFELSPDRGRFALAFSLAEDHSFYFSLPVARFATPDLGYINGHYVSLFAPGVSFIIIPGFLLGKMFGFAQVGAFAVIAVFALLNTILIRKIAIKLGANTIAATVAALTFLFATPAFTYGVTLYQHHISTFLILLSLYILLTYRSIWATAAIWFLFAASLPIDNPNLFLMAPIALAAAGRFFYTKKIKRSEYIGFRYRGIVTFLAAILPLAFFLWFNQMSYGSPFQLGGAVASVKIIDANGKPAAPKKVDAATAEKYLNPEKQQKSVVKFFQTRNLVNGFYEHFISRDRGILYFTPVIFFSLIGMYFLYKKNTYMTSLLLGIIGSTVLLYSMWGDPYGGWAFGSRYLIPAYAICAIFIGVALTSVRRKTLLILFFFILLTYSVAVNTLGAITSSRNPPKAEVLSLEKLSGHEEKYSYDRNYQFLMANQSKSFFWQTYLSSFVPAQTYYWILTGCIVLVSGGYLLALTLQTRRKEIEHEINA